MPDVATWDAWLESPGGELHFGLELSEATSDGPARAWVINGSERIEVPTVAFKPGSDVLLRFDHYDSEIVARFEDDDRLHGEWTKMASTI